MTLFQCRRFHFFNLEKMDIDIKETLKGALIRCGSSGRGCIYLGDSDGVVHLITRQLTPKSVAGAHLKGIIQIQQCQQSSFLVTFGEDEYAAYSLKVWNTTLVEQDPMKRGLSLKRVIKLNGVKPPTCFAAHENLKLLAVGYEDGEIQLYRGEFTKYGTSKPKPKILQGEGKHGSVTGLAFKTMEQAAVLFSVCKHAVTPFDVTNQDRDIKLQGDKHGGDLNCCCYAQGSSSSDDDHFIVGRSDAVYCYNHEGRGPCYGFDGEKHLLYYFRGYLLIIALISVESYLLTIFDCAKSYVAFQSTIHSSQPIKVAASEWGCLFLVASDGSVWKLKERDLQFKMNVFFKKSHYDLAIKVAKSNNFDAQGMADIYRQYGDHLYYKGDLDGAIRQYSKTVGKLEASYVVQKYMDGSQVLNLLEYLEEIHKRGIATQDMTTLLLNCLLKLKQNEKLEGYLKDPSCNFLEPETAIKVLKRGGLSKQAYQLATKHELYGCALQIIIDDGDDVREPTGKEGDLYNILEKVVQGVNAHDILRKYGSSLVRLVSQEIDPTESWRKIVSLLVASPSKREFVELFISTKEIFVPLLEDICQDLEASDGPLMNLLLEAYLDQWTKKKDTDNVATKEKLLDLLAKAQDCETWDWARALLACKVFGFSPGEIIAFENLGLHNDLLVIHHAEALSSPSLWPKFFETCEKYAERKLCLWKDAFYLITTTTQPEAEGPQNVPNSYCPKSIVEDILEQILSHNLIEPLQIIDRLCKTTLKLGSARQFLSKVLDRKGIQDCETGCKKLEDETMKVRHHIETLRTRPLVFQGTRCDVCSQKLNFPSLHFLCQHSFHQQCFSNFAANEKDCPVCWERNQDLTEAEQKRTNKNHLRASLDAEFTIKLNNSKSNSFAVIADAISKGIFKEDSQKRGEILVPKLLKLRVPATAQSFDTRGQEATSEARLRLREGTSITSRLEESPQMQTKKASPVSITAAAQQSAKQPQSKNPFEEKDEDACNPFAQASEAAAAEPVASTNPFDDDEDDYDSSLNPFVE